MAQFEACLMRGQAPSNFLVSCTAPAPFKSRSATYGAAARRAGQPSISTNRGSVVARGCPMLDGEGIPGPTSKDDTTYWVSHGLCFSNIWLCPLFAHRTMFFLLFRNISRMAASSMHPSYLPTGSMHDMHPLDELLRRCAVRRVRPIGLANFLCGLYVVCLIYAR